MQMHYLNYKSRRMEQARRLAKACSSPGDLAEKAGISYEEAYKLWWGTINKEALRERCNGLNADNE